MKKLVTPCLLAFLALQTIPAAAQAVSQPAAVDPKAIELAHSILVATHADSNSEAGITAMTPTIVEMLKRDKADIPDSVIQKFIAVFQEKMKESVPEMLNVEAQIYARHYTLDELTEIAHFYQSDVGKKVIQETPSILKETISVGQAWGREAGTRAMEETIETLRKQGIKI